MAALGLTQLLEPQSEVGSEARTQVAKPPRPVRPTVTGELGASCPHAHPLARALHILSAQPRTWGLQDPPRCRCSSGSPVPPSESAACSQHRPAAASRPEAASWPHPGLLRAERRGQRSGRGVRGHQSWKEAEKWAAPSASLPMCDRGERALDAHRGSAVSSLTAATPGGTALRGEIAPALSGIQQQLP